MPQLVEQNRMGPVGDIINGRGIFCQSRRRAIYYTAVCRSCVRFRRVLHHVVVSVVIRNIFYQYHAVSGNIDVVDAFADSADILSLFRNGVNFLDLRKDFRIAAVFPQQIHISIHCGVDILPVGFDDIRFLYSLYLVVGVGVVLFR